MRILTTVAAGFLLGIGVPKRLLLTCLAAATIVTAGLADADQAALVVVYVALATALVWGPLALFLLLGKRVIAFMEGAQSDIGRRQPQLTVYALLILAALRPRRSQRSAHVRTALRPLPLIASAAAAWRQHRPRLQASLPSAACGAREADPVVEPHVCDEGRPYAATGRPSFIDRNVRRIANSRSLVLGLSLTFVGLAFIGAIVMRIVDPDNFPSLGLAIWWALQTVTTVGYGDVVPTTGVGQVVGGIEMVIGISFIAFLTAGVTSTVIQRASAKAQAVERAHDERDVKTILDALVETRRAITELDTRLDRIESKVTASG